MSGFGMTEAVTGVKWGAVSHYPELRMVTLKFFMVTMESVSGLSGSGRSCEESVDTGACKDYLKS